MAAEAGLSAALLPSRAADEVFAVQWHYARSGRSLAEAALAGARRFTAWAHHPRADAVDVCSGTRFYYHAHEPDDLPDEHGHFHVFVPHPQALNDLTHLAALSLDAHGVPQRWFTTNAWVTGERWCPADLAAHAVPALQLSARGRLAPVARWLAAMVRLYAPLITELLHERDAVLRRLAARAGNAALQPDDAVLADRRLHIVSQRAISLAERLRELPPAGALLSSMETSR